MWKAKWPYSHRSKFPHKNFNLPSPRFSKSYGGLYADWQKGRILTCIYSYTTTSGLKQCRCHCDFLSLRCKWILRDYLNAKQVVWKSAAVNPPVENLLRLFHKKKCHNNSALRCPTHYSPAGSEDMFKIQVLQNVKWADVLFWHCRADHLAIISQILNRVRVRDYSSRVAKFTDRERFSIACLT